MRYAISCGRKSLLLLLLIFQQPEKSFKERPQFVLVSFIGG